MDGFILVLAKRTDITLHLGGYSTCRHTLHELQFLDDATEAAWPIGVAL